MRIERHNGDPAWEGADLRRAGIAEVPLLGIYEHRAATHPLAVHEHAGHMEICYLAAGRQVYGVGGRDYVLEAGDLFVTQPDALHGSGSYPEEKGTLHWVQVRLTGGPREDVQASRRASASRILEPGRPRPGGRPRAPRLQTEGGPGPGVGRLQAESGNGAGFLGLPAAEGRALIKALQAIPSPHGVANEEVRRLFPRMQELVRRPETALVRAQVRAGLVALLAAVAESLAAPATRRVGRGLNAVLALIDAELGEDLSIPRLAGVAKLSVPWFQARFRREIGLPPAEYVLRRRIERAAAWLQAGGRSVTDIAFELGFSSTQYFATAYRRYRGRSPSEERGSNYETREKRERGRR